MDKDLESISNHFVHIRTFYATYMGVEIMPFVAKYNLIAGLGVSIPNGQTDLDAALNAIDSYPNNLAAIYIGNEDLQPNGPFSVDDILWNVNTLREGMKGAKIEKTLPIGTVQRINEWLNPSSEIDRLIEGIDVVGVNIYPFFNTAQNDGEKWFLNSQPIDYMAGELSSVLNRHSQVDKSKFIITETGWPSGPEGVEAFSGNMASFEQSEKYFFGYLGWACTSGREFKAPTYFYTYFDGGAWDKESYESFFGLVDIEGNAKWDLPNKICQ